MADPSNRLAAFAVRVVIAAVIVAAVLLAWRLRHVLLLLFAAVLLALLLRGLSDPLARATKLNERLAVVLTALGLSAVVVGAITFFGFAIQDQVADLISTLPAAWEAAQNQLRDTALGSRLLVEMENVADAFGLDSVLALQKYLAPIGAIAANLLLVLAAGVYLALEPHLYREGFLRLLPASGRAAAADTLNRTASSLQSWLLAQAAAMLAVGTVTAIGLWIIGVPSPLALGLLAGLADFVPLVGPVLAAVPALLLAATLGWDSLGWTLLLIVAIQQVEGNVLLPLLQRQIVSLPPVLTLFALVAFTVVFGPLGLLRAAPITAALFVVVKRLYLKEGVDEG
jgi:predicted PurR-regulated permease PerM